MKQTMEERFDEKVWLFLKKGNTRYLDEDQVKLYVASELALRDQELIEKIKGMKVPPYPIEDDSNPELVALQEGAQIGYREALTDVSEVVRKQV